MPGTAGPEGDASAADAQDEDMPCQMPLTGDGPFGMQLEALSFPEGFSYARTFAIFFPEGRQGARRGYFSDEWNGPDVDYQALMVADEFSIAILTAVDDPTSGSTSCRGRCTFDRGLRSRRRAFGAGKIA